MRNASASLAPSAPQPTLAERFLRRPRTLFFRKAVFQVHLWTALIAGIYVFLISISGAVLVFRSELISALWTPGAARPFSIRILGWLTNLHFNLLAGGTGRLVNGGGGLVLVLLAATGATIWWPGTHLWRSRLMVHKRSNWKRLNWDLHTVFGFWLLGFAFIWGLTGAYLAFPFPFHAAINFFTPLAQTGTGPSLGDSILQWGDYLHFGSFGGLPVKMVWAVVALVPPFLFITGLLMWWNRVITRVLRSRRHLQRKTYDALGGGAVLPLSTEKS